ncbi:P-loop containing nucleoside triphosphate hydrolase protein [Xylaria intraflava]|nr:P-loop containing nucleoside triphosphate hydrolase protein [Xylaria intraflava]
MDSPSDSEVYVGGLDSPGVEDITRVIADLTERPDASLFKNRCRWLYRYTQTNRSLQRSFIASVICYITGADEARQGQVDAVQRLAFERADTVLVAATGYGKSVVLYAFTAVTDLITIQIVPLTQLGLAQLADIERDVAGSTPVFIDGDTYLKNKEIWKEVESCKYSHILLSPEQALNPQFKAILRSPVFHSRVGLFAIDELHVVREWREFRRDFIFLHTLRSLLPRRVPWFGCTATLERDHQSFILEHAGFDLSALEIIRTSVDRPEISLVVQPLLRGFIRDRRRLEFLLENADPQRVKDIPKTIIYVDSKAMLQAVRHHLIQYLKGKGFSTQLAKQTVTRYDADVRPADKERIYSEFSRPDTLMRVALVTIAFGMGLHLPDVRRVVQYGLPIEPSIADIWQRIGRAMRKIPGQGRAYVFAPYWLFDHLGLDSLDSPGILGSPSLPVDYEK